MPVVVECNGIAPGRSPLRRLTTYEYNNTIRDLLGDTTNPGSALPAQVDSKQNPFGNDADEQSPTDVLVEKYQTVSESIAARATANATALAKLHSCAGTVTAANEEACARMIATSLAPRAYRRAADAAEIDELVALYKNVRALSTTTTFASGVAAMVEALLQAPEFLYRVELGAPVADNLAVKRVAGREMATRLSYMFWQTMPDTALFQAADAGMLDTNDGVLEQARKLLDDPKSHPMVAFFFDNLLPIPDLSGLTRDAALFPTWSPTVGAAMRTEVQRFLEHEIYENTAQSAPPYAAGSWPAILTAPYTFVNQTLFSHYGASSFASGTSVTGTALTKVNLNTTQRLGLLTLGGMGAGSTTSNLTNPVLRGLFVTNKLMCRNIELPTGFTPMAPDPYSGKTARERYSQALHRRDLRRLPQVHRSARASVRELRRRGPLSRERALDGSRDEHDLRHADRRQRLGAGRQRNGAKRGGAGEAARDVPGDRELLRVALAALHLRAIAGDAATPATSKLCRPRSRTPATT